MATVYVRVLNVNGFVVFLGRREKRFYLSRKDSYQREIFKGSTREIFEKVPTFTR